MNGAGNDFMVIDARGQELNFSALALDLCKRTGADGFMAVDDSDIADFRLHFYNADGSRGEMCGNGARCICRFAYENGIAGERMTVRTDAGIVYGRRLNESSYRVRLNEPSVTDLERKGKIAYVELGDPGVPHAVVEVDAPPSREQLRELGKTLRYDPAFPKGANVNFFYQLEEGHVQVLTYERGVEDFTQACGTGCGSVACVLHDLGRLPKCTLTAENEGGQLKVFLGAKRKAIVDILLEGPTAIVTKFDM
jgi:diaminopimelate epimerase